MTRPFGRDCNTFPAISFLELLINRVSVQMGPMSHFASNPTRDLAEDLLQSLHQVAAQLFDTRVVAVFSFLKCRQEAKKPCTTKRAKQYDHGIEIASTAKSAENPNSERPLRPFPARRPTQHYRPFHNKRKDLSLHVFLPDRAVGRHIEHIFPFRQPPHPHEQVNDNFV